MASLIESESKKSAKFLESEYEFIGWKIKTVESHILTKLQDESFTNGLNLRHLPDMVFSQNVLSITKNGEGIIFSPYDALKHVNDHEDLVHVAGAKEWLEARKESAHLHNIAHPYDWTFTPTNYKGTTAAAVNVSSTTEKIDYEKLKHREKILFYKDVVLYEDELDDNGCSKLSIKIRVMPTGFFCLQRFYLRVDNTLIRVIDTRLYCCIENPNEILREYSERECSITELSAKKIPPSIWIDQNEIVNHLTLKKESYEKLCFPS
jgi:type 2A phosphatase activator TIP41